MNSKAQTWTWTRGSTFPSDMGTARNLIAEVLDAVRAENWNEKDMFALELILEETLTNAIQHGNRSDPSKNVRFDCKLNPKKVYVRIEDEGAGFNPHSVPDPREEENQVVPSGRGVLLVKYFATEAKWNDRGNVIEFEKDRS